MKTAKVSFKESVEEAVIDAGKCVGCGACRLLVLYMP
jgi:ferredoxin